MRFGKLQESGMIKKVKYNHYRDTFIAYRAYDFGLFCRGCSLYDYYESQGRYSSFLLLSTNIFL